MHSRYRNNSGLTREKSRHVFVPIPTYVSGQVAMLLKYWDALGVDSSAIGSYHYQDLEAMEEQGSGTIIR